MLNDRLVTHGRSNAHVLKRSSAATTDGLPIVWEKRGLMKPMAASIEVRQGLMRFPENSTRGASMLELNSVDWTTAVPKVMCADGNIDGWTSK